MKTHQGALDIAKAILRNERSTAGNRLIEYHPSSLSLKLSREKNGDVEKEDQYIHMSAVMVCPQLHRPTANQQRELEYDAWQRESRGRERKRNPLSFCPLNSSP